VISFAAAWGRRGFLRRLLALAAMLRAGRAAAQAAPATVEIVKFAFVPAEIEVRAGDSIRFINRDLAPHTATAGDASFDTGTLGKDEVATILFPARGSFPYFCRFHRHMTGIARVT
jgi:plastocyanin